MASIDGFTKERMLAIENASVVDGDVVGDNLILTRHDGTTINAGSVRGPIGSPGISNETLDAGLNEHVPIGISFDYIGTTAPTFRWLLMTGQTVVDGQTLYPEFWSKIPASMKSGANIIMPDTRHRISVGFDSTDPDFDTIGKVGGTKAVVLTRPQLPLATIQINPPPTGLSGATGDDLGGHQHILGGQTSPGGMGNHTNLGETTDSRFIMMTPGGPHSIDILHSPEGGATVTTPLTTGGSTVSDLHQHPLPAATGAPVNYHKHPAGTLSVDIPPFPSEALGSGEAHNNMPPYITFTKIIKVL